jgi:hypothetical protein
MEDTLERLKILDYETELCMKKNFLPLSRTYFALPTSNASTQFSCFLTLCEVSFVGILVLCLFNSFQVADQTMQSGAAG